MTLTMRRTCARQNSRLHQLDFAIERPKTDLLEQRVLGVPSRADAPSSICLTAFLASCNSSNRDDWLDGRWIRRQPAVLPASGTELYLGIDSVAEKTQGREAFTEVAVLNTERLDRVPQDSKNRANRRLASR